MSLLDHPDAQALLADAAVTPDQVRGCQDRLTAFLERYLPRFYRAEQLVTDYSASYKQRGDPCYDARAVARNRAADAAPCSSPVRRRRGPRRGCRCPAFRCPGASTAARCRRCGVLDMREADPRSGPLHPATWGALGGPSARAGAKAIVMVNRRGFAPCLTCRSCGRALGLPQLRRFADRPPPQRPPRLPSLRPHRAAAARLRRVRLDDPLPGGWGRSRSRRCWPSAWRRCRSSASTPTSQRPRRPCPNPRRLRRGRDRRPRRHPDGRQGARLPRGDPERDPRRRRDPQVPRLPRRRADFRDGRPAPRPQRPGTPAAR